MARSKAAPIYPGPLWAEIEDMADAEVDHAFIDLKHEPPSRDFHPEDDQWFIAAHGDQDDDYKWTAKEIKALRQRVHEWWRGCLRNELFKAHIEQWVSSLSEDACWLLIEVDEGKKPTLNDKRYTPVEAVRRRAAEAVWRIEYMKASTEAKGVNTNDDSSDKPARPARTRTKATQATQA
jgi:hypothetical protein